MVVFTKRSKAKGSTAPAPALTVSTPSLKPMRWSDIAAGRGSTLSDKVTFQAIMDITELCEHVLFHLPTTDLYRAKRVCRQFKSVIDNSPQLQENLFLKPRRSRTVWATPETDETFTLLTGSKAAQHIATSHSNGAPTSEVDILELHPLLFTRPQCDMNYGVTHFLYSYNNERYTPAEKDSPVDFVTSPFERNARSALRHPSMHRVYISQPPAKEVSVDIAGRSYYPHISANFWTMSTVSTITVRNDSGITFGQLLQDIDLGMRRASNDRTRFEHMYFLEGVPMTAYVKNIIETASGPTGEITSETDPFNCKNDRLDDRVDFDYAKYQPWHWPTRG